MESCKACVLVALAVLAHSADVPAQPMAAQGSFEGFDCKMLASIPNAPMSVETCEAQMAAHSSLQQALAQGGGERPGDTALTCQQIAEEIKSTKAIGRVPGKPRGGSKRRPGPQGHAGALHAEAMARSARQTGQTAAAAMAGSNAAQGAVMYGQLAENKAASELAMAQMGPASNRDDRRERERDERSRREHPREPALRPLLMLAGDKNCQM